MGWSQVLKQWLQLNKVVLIYFPFGHSKKLPLVGTQKKKDITSSKMVPQTKESYRQNHKSLRLILRENCDVDLTFSFLRAQTRNVWIGWISLKLRSKLMKGTITIYQSWGIREFSYRFLHSRSFDLIMIQILIPHKHSIMEIINSQSYKKNLWDDFRLTEY